MTLRACPVAPSLRDRRIFSTIQTALRASNRARFRVLQFSVQADHLHLLAEANAPRDFERGLRGLAVRVAKAANRLLGRRGQFWADRYHARLLRTPREVRNVLVYILNNVRKHLRAVAGIDPCSSGPWFTGWRRSIDRCDEASPVSKAQTWLAAIGWRRHGLIDLGERPGGVHSRRRP